MTTFIQDGFRHAIALGTTTTPMPDVDIRVWARAQGLKWEGLFAGTGLELVPGLPTIDWNALTYAQATSPNGASLGTQFWRFNDSRQASEPVYLKVSYALRRYNNGGAFWGVVAPRVEVGVINPTTGTFSGSTMVADFMNGSTSSLGGAADAVDTVFACQIDNYFGLYYLSTFTAVRPGGMVVIERLRKPDGTWPADGRIGMVATHWAGSATQWYLRGNYRRSTGVVNQLSTTNVMQGVFPVIGVWGTITDNDASVLHRAVFDTQDGPQIMRNVIGYYPTDVQELSFLRGVPLIGGGEGEFFTVGGSYGGSGFGFGSSSIYLAGRWE